MSHPRHAVPGAASWAQDARRPRPLPWTLLSFGALGLGLVVFAVLPAVLAAGARVAAVRHLLAQRAGDAHAKLGLALVLDGIALLTWVVSGSGLAGLAWAAPGILGSTAGWLAWRRAVQLDAQRHATWATDWMAWRQRDIDASARRSDPQGRWR